MREVPRNGGLVIHLNETAHYVDGSGVVHRSSDHEGRREGMTKITFCERYGQMALYDSRELAVTTNVLTCVRCLAHEAR